ncbi:hypothetical protein AgCh_016728 [Apium graveolens]
MGVPGHLKAHLLLTFSEEVLTLEGFRARLYAVYSIEEILPVMQPPEDGIRGQRPPRICLDGRPPPVVNECPFWGCGVNSDVCFGSSVSVVNGCPRWETLEYPVLCTQKLGITCPVI